MKYSGNHYFKVLMSHGVLSISHVFSFLNVWLLFCQIDNDIVKKLYAGVQLRMICLIFYQYQSCVLFQDQRLVGFPPLCVDLPVWSHAHLVRDISAFMLPVQMFLNISKNNHWLVLRPLTLICRLCCLSSQA